MSDLHKKRLSVFNVILLIILIFYALFLVVLMLWGLSTSLKTTFDFEMNENKLLLPSGSIKDWAWSNYSYVWNHFAVLVNSGKQKIDIYGQLINTLLYAVGGGLVTTFCCCIVAYLSAKFKYWFSEFLYTLVLVTMVIPIVGSTPAMLKFLHATNLFDTWLGTYLMKATFLGLYFLVFHGIYRGISPEYSEAATIDGANEYQIFFKIMFPLVMTTFYTIFLINFIGYWNDYNTALMFMPTHPTLAYGVYSMSNNVDNKLTTVPMRMVSCVILALPITVVFVVFRKKVMGNVTMGGVKE